MLKRGVKLPAYASASIASILPQEVLSIAVRHLHVRSLRFAFRSFNPGLFFGKDDIYRISRGLIGSHIDIDGPKTD